MTEPGSEKIRVLVVDDIPDTRENLRKLLYFETDIELVGAVASGREAVAQAQRDQPDVVLMDINMPDMDGITAAEEITQAAPACQVIMMSVQSEADYLRRSMLAGAMDFLIKPFSGEELSNSIRRVHSMGVHRRPSRPAPPSVVPAAGRDVGQPSVAPGGKVLAFFSPKGGTGCTTLAVNLGLALAQQNSGRAKTVLVDASLQFGDVGALMNLPPTSHSISALTARRSGLTNDHLSAVLTPHSSGLRVLLAPPRPDMAESIDPELVQEVIARLRSIYDYVVVDTWSVLSDAVLGIFDLADRIYVVLTPEIPAIKNTKLLFDVLADLEYPIERVRLLVNKVDRSSGIRVSQIEAHLKHPVDARIALDDRTANQAINEGRPVVLGAPGSVLAEGILSLAQRVAAEAPETAGTTSAPSEGRDEEPSEPAVKQKPKRRGLFSLLQG